jgi:ribosomal protein S24E
MEVGEEERRNPLPSPSQHNLKEYLVKKGGNDKRNGNVWNVDEERGRGKAKIKIKILPFLYI